MTGVDKEPTRSAEILGIETWIFYCNFCCSWQENCNRIKVLEWM